MRIKPSTCAGRTVRDIVECTPEQVTEVWCRKIFRQLLHALERQYAMQLPHRAITPDTVVVHDDGALLLLPSLVSDPTPEIADDLTALARIVHYAITHEVVPIAPLQGRALEGYSDSLIAAVDRSLAFDPARRPRSIGELRDILGIVAFRQAPPARKHVQAMQAHPLESITPQALQPPKLPRPGRIRMRSWPWVWAGSIIAALLLAGLAIFADQRAASTFDRIASTLPAQPDALRGKTQAQAPVSVAPASSSLEPSDTSRILPPLAEMQPDQDAAADAPQAGKVADKKAGKQEGRPAAETPPGAESASAGAARTAARRTQTKRASPPKHERRLQSAAVAAPVAPPRSGAPAPSAQPASPAASGKPEAATAAAGAVFELQIQPWGAVYVDGVKRGISPPVKQLVLGPGRHSIRVTNPAAKEHILEVDTATGNGRIAVDFDHVAR